MTYTDPEAIQVSEILDVVSTRVPEMITNLLRTVYSEDAGRNVGKAVAALYRELVDAGLPRDVAVKMASGYMISFKDLVGSVGSVASSGHTPSSDPAVSAPEAPRDGQ
jgi:hypothetical protein